MGAKEFFYAIGMEKIFDEAVGKPLPEPDERKYNRRTEIKNVSNYKLRCLGRYRSYVYKEKMLKREILRLTAIKMRLENGKALDVPERRWGSRKSTIINLWLELSQVQLKKRELEQLCGEIDDPFVKSVVVTRYFKNPEKRLVAWSQTAKDMGLPMSGEDIRKKVTAYFEK